VREGRPSARPWPSRWRRRGGRGGGGEEEGRFGPSGPEAEGASGKERGRPRPRRSAWGGRCRRPRTRLGRRRRRRRGRGAERQQAKSRMEAEAEGLRSSENAEQLKARRGGPDRGPRATREPRAGRPRKQTPSVRAGTWCAVGSQESERGAAGSQGGGGRVGRGATSPGGAPARWWCWRDELHTAAAPVVGGAVCDGELAEQRTSQSCEKEKGSVDLEKARAERDLEEEGRKRRGAEAKMRGLEGTWSLREEGVALRKELEGLRRAKGEAERRAEKAVRDLEGAKGRGRGSREKA